MNDTDPNQPALVALDWGTSSLRAYLLDARGAVIGRRETANGIQPLAGGGFREAFERCCTGWLEQRPGLGAIACGMIGSRQGWREAPYLSAPAGFEGLASQLLRLDDIAGRPFAIVPGVCAMSPGGVHDVMRGEETQAFGALAALATRDAVVLLPGTHSKWVHVQDERIERFRTCMTGELYSVLARHSILGRLFPDESEGASTDLSDKAFTDGLDRAMADPAALISLLFSVRAEGLFGVYEPASLPAYLSGLLIGAEIGHALRDTVTGTNAPPIIVVGSPVLERRYLFALARAGVDARAAPADVTAGGLAAIARRAGLLPGA